MKSFFKLLLRHSKHIVGIVISVLFLYFIFKQVNSKEVLSSIYLMKPDYIWSILIVYYSSFVLRAYRWKALTPELKGVNILEFWKPMMTGFSMNCALPARAGDVYRSHMFGKKNNISRMSALASIGVERILDGITLFLMLLMIILVFYQNPIFTKIVVVSGVAFLGGLGLLVFVAKRKEFLGKKDKEGNIKERFSYYFNSFIKGLSVFHCKKSFIVSLLLSFAVWILESIFMLLVIKSFGINLNLIQSTLVLAVTALATMIPAGPAGVGPYQYGYMIALGFFGVGKELSLAISITNQAMFIAMLMPFGIFYYIKE